MLLGAVAFLLLVGGCQASRAGIYPYNWGIFWDSLLRPSPRIVNGIWLTVSIAIYNDVQVPDYAAAGRTAFYLLGFSFVALAVTYALQRRAWVL